VVFDIGLGEIGVLLLAALFVFGPDRLPTVAAQAARMLRQLRLLAAGAREQLTDAIGPELRDLDVMKDLTELNQLRRFDPKSIIASALRDDADPLGGNARPASNGSSSPGVAADPAAPPRPPSFDPDAT
jgi:sec-independent protein translocase protein TatB